ncbi:MAG: MoaD/ThiS family protein [bacterium]|nr:MoaD/ThiS family protein [bacterium]
MTHGKRTTIKFGACAILSAHLGGRRGTSLTLEPAATVREAVARAGVPEDEVWLVAVNGLKASWERRLEEGDEVKVFAPVGGG